MTVSDPYLGTHAPELIDALLKHPLQWRARGMVADLLHELRSCKEWADYYEFQGLLFHRLYEAQLHRSQIKRGIRRVAAGKPPEVEAICGDLTTELLGLRPSDPTVPFDR